MGIASMRCPKCGYTQLASPACQSCGVAIGSSKLVQQPPPQTWLQPPEGERIAFKENEEIKKRPTSVTFICWILGVGLSLFIFFPGSWIGPGLKIWAARRGINLYITPSQRKIKQFQQESNVPKFSYLGIEFQTPWKQLIEQKTFGDNAVLLKFPEDKSIYLLSDFSKSDLREAWFSGGSPQEVNALKERLGAKEIDFSSDYEFRKWFLSQTPEEIGFFTPPRTVLARSVVLIFKSIAIVGRKTDKIYNFKTEQIKGFQYGDPERGINAAIPVEVWDNKEHRYFFVIQGTQDDIDFILSSTLGDQ
jgi:hypothetical protein